MYYTGTRKRPEHFEKMTDDEAIKDLLGHLRRRSGGNTRHPGKKAQMKRYEEAILNLCSRAKGER